MLKEITDEEFITEVEQFKGVALVDFWATWCGPCRMMAPVFERVSQKYPNIKFCKVNTDENMEKAAEYGVSGIPCIIVFKDGKEVDRLIGFRDEASFDAAIKKYA
jgi:thioredoxin 1